MKGHFNMIRSTIGIIVFCVFLGSNAASSNPSFIDTISIPGAKCIISIPMDSNSLYSSFKHPCSNYYFFKLGNRCPCCRYSNLLIHFSSTVKCTLFVKSVQFRDPFKQLPSDTLPISCDSLIYYFGFGIAFSYNNPLIVSVNDSIQWGYACPVGKRLTKANQISYNGGDLLHFILKSTNDSSEVYFSRTIVHFTQIKNQLYKTTNNTKFVSKAYTINGALIQSNRRLPSLYILKDNAAANSMVRLNKF